MISKSGHRFSEKIMRKPERAIVAVDAIHRKHALDRASPALAQWRMTGSPA
jgi:hypothetical protein